MNVLVDGVSGAISVLDGLACRSTGDEVFPSGRSDGPTRDGKRAHARNRQVV